MTASPEQPRVYSDAELRYAATARCSCGAGLAYPAFEYNMHGAWDCADILTGRAIPSGQPGAVTHTDRLPFAFYEIKSEDQPSANGTTTRPRPLTEHESLQRDVAQAHATAESLSGQLAKSRADVERLEAEFKAAEARWWELRSRYESTNAAETPR